MKRIRGEQMASTVGQYLKRRHYTEPVDVSANKRNVQNTQTLGEMALRASVAWQQAVSNAIAYTSITVDAASAEQQYNKFDTYIKEAIEPYRTELRPLVFPIFVHMYLELINNGHTTAGHALLGKHTLSHREDTSQAEIMDLLQEVYNTEDVDNSGVLAQLRDNKFQITLSEDAFNYLIHFLKRDENILLMQLFNQNINITVEDTDGQEDTEHIPDSLQETETETEPPDDTTEGQGQSQGQGQGEVTLSSLKECIKKVRDGPPCLTSICFYTFLNTYQGLCSAKVSKDHSRLSGTFEDSTVKVWSLSPKPIHTSPEDIDISQVNLVGDYKEDVTHRQKLQWGASDKECVTLRGHSATVYSSCFVPDTHYLLSASDDTSVRLWDLESCSNRAVYRGHNYPVWDVHASVNGYFVTGSHDRTAKLWCLDRVHPLRTFACHVQDVDCVQFHPNSNYIATGSSDKTVRLWNIQDGRPVRLFQGHRATVFALAFSPNGQFLASAGEDRRVKVWDLSNGTLLKDLKGHTDTVYCLSFNRDSTMLASGGLDCMLRVWDVRKAATSEKTIDGHTSPELLGAFPTKATTVHHLQFASYNLLYAAGSFAS